jgi:hypothetical protein
MSAQVTRYDLVLLHWGGVPRRHKLFALHSLSCDAQPPMSHGEAPLSDPHELLVLSPE